MLENVVPLKPADLSPGPSPKALARTKALLYLKELADKSGDKSFVDAVTVLRPSLYGMSSGPRKTTRAKLVDHVVSMIYHNGTMTEEEIFAEAKIGRKECLALLKQSLRKAEPTERYWIKFNYDSDEDEGSYTFLSKGINPPTGWDGFVPNA